MSYGVHADAIILDNQTSDPASPEEGQLWFNSTDGRYRGVVGGVVVDFATLAELTAHITNTSNPHQVTLEQARAQNNVLSGDIDANGNKVTNLTNGVGLLDSVNLGQVRDLIDDRLAGLDWQESVLDKDLATPPNSPVDGDRYIVAAGATGAWAGQENNIAQWDQEEGAWEFATPDNGTHAPVVDESQALYVFNGTSWSLLPNVTSHGALSNLTADDHPQYHTDSRALTWLGTRSTTDLPEGSNLYFTDLRVTASPEVVANTLHRGLTNNPHAVTKGQVGLGNVENILNNDSATAPPTVNDDITQGYSIGSRVTDVVNGHVYVAIAVPAGAANWVRVDNDAMVSSLAHKAGTVPAASFALVGNRQQASVAFTSAFPDDTYSVTVSAEGQNGRRFLASAVSKTSSGFTIDLGTRNANNLLRVSWQAIAAGESA